MQCDSGSKTVSPQTLIDYSLSSWKRSLLSNRRREYRLDTKFPMHNSRLCMVVYCYSYHMSDASNVIRGKLWADKGIRQTLLRHRFDHHDCSHRSLCFKRGSKCRFMHPFLHALQLPFMKMSDMQTKMWHCAMTWT